MRRRKSDIAAVSVLGKGKDAVVLCVLHPRVTPGTLIAALRAAMVTMRQEHAGKRLRLVVPTIPPGDDDIRFIEVDLAGVWAGRDITGSFVGDAALLESLGVALQENPLFRELSEKNRVHQMPCFDFWD